MKSTTFIAVLLTLLSLLLIVGATTLFLVQDRQEMQTDAFLMQAEIEGHNQTIIQLQTTAAAREMMLATSEALVTTRDAEVSQSESFIATQQAELEQQQTTLNELEDTLSGLEATLEAERALVSDESPLVQIVSPLNGAVVTTDNSLEILVVGGYSQGVDNVSILVGDRPSFTIQDNGEAFRLYQHSVPGLSAGLLVITATLTTVDNQTVSDRVRITVRDSEPQQDSNGTQGSVSWFVADLPRE